MDKVELQKMLVDVEVKIKQLESALYQLVGRKMLLEELIDDKPKEEKK